jgi:hypothetical protein
MNDNTVEVELELEKGFRMPWLLSSSIKMKKNECISRFSDRGQKVDSNLFLPTYGRAADCLGLEAGFCEVAAGCPQPTTGESESAACSTES